MGNAGTVEPRPSWSWVVPVLEAAVLLGENRKKSVHWIEEPLKLADTIRQMS